MPPTSYITYFGTKFLKVNLFPRTKKIAHGDHRAGFTRTSNRPHEWRGDNKYHKVGVIGKGAFAVVHQVTAREDGKPYAAKELDKRKFMKNGILDQKVENEMKIMQRVKHVSKLSSGYFASS